MLTNIRPWGNSQGVYIPKKMLSEASIGVNDPVDISVEDGAIVIRKNDSSEIRRKHWESLKAIRNAHISDKAEHNSKYKKELEEYLDEKYGF